MIKPLTTEKAVMMIVSQNVLTFVTDKEKKKPEIKKELEEILEVKIDKIRVHIRNNKKHVYAKLKKEFPAIDVASKLGII